MIKNKTLRKKIKAHRAAFRRGELDSHKPRDLNPREVNKLFSDELLGEYKDVVKK